MCYFLPKRAPTWALLALCLHSSFTRLQRILSVFC